MTTVIIIIAVALVVAAAVYFFLVRGGSVGGGRSLRSRFGPEYDRVVARHNGDTKAAEQELDERVKLHGDLEKRPLTEAARADYTARWARTQEQFVESPQQALDEADALLADLSRDRGFPAGESFEDRTAALSVHHARHVEGYRRVHTARNDGTGTEEMREAFVEARGLFDALLEDGPATRDHSNRQLTKGRGTS
ncbi:hypothetical protein ACFY9Q_24270 [Streptomyces sp. NPDC012389]|uniref:hypothetical protein n=1 Tax=unclassified Streptomyces TaxID=2593676 RepID=UPI00081E7C25|nr:hypothetical protein [Streptomyces sp. ScaeMP-e83]MYR98329.1 hypothetical protein [Streptomyces sp. SID4937]MYX11972.1 hypothetical protein [Streptomyces sp. SID8374]SCE36801.1 hypothetical protein GA0115243_1115220 [Streptomyces sp. ScaeMP-e83]